MSDEYEHALERTITEQHEMNRALREAPSSLPPLAGSEVFFFGCKGAAGHYLHSRSGTVEYEKSPWGRHLDTGILVSGADKYARPDTTPTQNYTVARKDGWTAIAFWDRSGDSRPNSNSAFLIAADVSDKELLAMARAQWPYIFARAGFPLNAKLRDGE